ncbi:S-layer homology domain-containing protein [Ureibacillus sinduriensis]|uniref:S-layer homology domain-containing protein n=1 Tax=Ureibacillus sinduriensis TaxID=561440 RepID=UPI000A039F5E|nr:5'-nucleotidase C-terminal domain-containing protein [Ureibacillus sinduriensis]
MKNRANSKFMKATVATAIVASTFAAQAPLSTEASTSFPDVKPSSYYYDAIQTLAERKIINGYPDGKFHPQDQVTRGQAAKIIVGVLGLDTENVSNPNFSDVNTNHPFYAAIAALAEKGIIKGTGNGTFKPNEPIQRNHLAKIIAEAFNLQASNTNFPFTDVPKEYQNYVASLYDNGITTGKTSTLFGGRASTTRGEFAVFIHRAENVKSQPVENITTSVNFTVESVASNQVQTSTGSYAIDASLQSFFAGNAIALKGADIKAVIQEGKVVRIEDLSVNSAGTATTPVVIDGANTTIAGNLQVNADYVSVKNLNVEGHITLSANVINSYLSDNVDAKGDFIIAEAGPVAVASLNEMAANTTKGPKVDLRNSSQKSVHIKRNHVEFISNTRVPEIIVTANGSSITINADVGQVTINGSANIEIKGSGNIEKLTVDQAKEIALNITGQIKELIVMKGDSKVEIGVGLRIAKLVIPDGVTAGQVIRNFEAVKGQIEAIVNNNGTNNSGNNNGSNGGNGGSGGGNNGPGGGNNNGGTQPPKNFTLNLTYTNDSHANVEKYPRLVTAAKEVKNAKPNSVLVHAGDVFSGTLYFNEFKGQADLEFMNLMGYDMMTFGNHEFDLGSSPEGHKALADFIKGAKFPFVSSNIDFSKDSNLQGLFSDLNSSNPKDGQIYNGIVKEIDGQKVGFFGLTTAETADISSPGAVEFEDYIKEAEKAVKAFENMGVNKIVAITHIGYDDNAAVDNDLELAKKVEGIDVIVGGHSHTKLDKPYVVGTGDAPTVIVQAYQYNDYLGTLDVTFDRNGKVVLSEGNLIDINAKVKDGDGKEVYKFAEDAEAVAKLAPYKTVVEKTAGTQIGVELKERLVNPRTSDAGNTEGISVRKNETILGNIITDGMLEKAKKAVPGKNIIMALQNGGGIRAAIEAGPVTVGEVITVLPYGNTLATMDLTGAEIKQAFETSFKSYPSESGGFLHVSGAKVEFDSSKPVGQRVVSVKYKDGSGNFTELKDSENYTIATNAFTAKGGDGYDVFAKAYGEGRVTDLGLSDWENFRDHLVSLKDTGIPIVIEGRIVDVAGQQNPGTELPGGDYDGAEFSGTAGQVKVYSGDATVDISNINSLGNAVVKGNLIIKGKATGEITFANIQVEGNLDLTELEADTQDFTGITVDGETIL